MPKKKVRCRFVAVPELFKWGDTTPHWSDAVDDYEAVRNYNRLCQYLSRRDPNRRK